MHITERNELQSLEIGDVLIVGLLGRFALRTIDTGNMRLLLQNLDTTDTKPIWYGYDSSETGWRPLFQIYSGSLQLDMSQRAVGIDKEGVAKGFRQAPKYRRSDTVHSFTHGYLDPSDRRSKQFLDP